MNITPKDLLNVIGNVQTGSEVCPRCGMNTLATPLVHNSLSRYADVYICNECGDDEALSDYFGEPMPLEEWFAVKVVSK